MEHSLEIVNNRIRRMLDLEGVDMEMFMTDVRTLTELIAKKMQELA